MIIDIHTICSVYIYTYMYVYIYIYIQACKICGIIQASADQPTSRLSAICVHQPTSRSASSISSASADQPTSRNHRLQPTSRSSDWIGWSAGRLTPMILAGRLVGGSDEADGLVFFGTSPKGDDRPTPSSR